MNNRQWLHVRTQEFKKWFGDWEADPANASKIVDENGEPKVLFRGESEKSPDFTIFLRKFTNKNNTQSDGFYFTNSYNYASGFGAEPRMSFLSIKNPFYGKVNEYGESGGWANPDYLTIDEKNEIVRQIVEEYSDLVKEGDTFENIDVLDFDDFLSVFNSGNFDTVRHKVHGDIEIRFSELIENVLHENRLISEKMERDGYDGQYDSQIGGADKGTIQVIAFYSEQIKSATSNNGKYDPDNGDINFAEAWHGSGKAFDKFSTSKILSGTGNASFGWGIYLTDSQFLARYYAMSLSFYVNGKLWKDAMSHASEPHIIDAISMLAKAKGDKAFALKMGAKYLEAKRDRLKRLSSQENSEIGSFEIRNAQRKVDEFERSLDWLRDADVRVDPRRLYKVAIKGDTPLEDLNFIRWNRPPKGAVKALLMAARDDLPYGGRLKISKKGSEIYKQLSSSLLGDEKASKWLLSHGIGGIVYPSNRGYGSLNYVVFDENDLEIRNRIDFAEESQESREKQLSEADAAARKRMIGERGGERINIVRSPDRVPSLNQKQAEAWARKNLRGRPLQNEDTGRVFYVSSKGIGKMLAGNKGFALERIAAIYSLPGLVKQAKGVQMPDGGGNRAVSAAYHLYVPFSFNGLTYRVRLVAREFHNGQRPDLHSYRIEDVVIENEKEPVRPSRNLQNKGIRDAYGSSGSLDSMTVSELFNERNPKIDFAEESREGGGKQDPVPDAPLTPAGAAQRVLNDAREKWVPEATALDGFNDAELADYVAELAKLRGGTLTAVERENVEMAGAEAERVLADRRARGAALSSCRAVFSRAWVLAVAVIFTLTSGMIFWG